MHYFVNNARTRLKFIVWKRLPAEYIGTRNSVDKMTLRGDNAVSASSADGGGCMIIDEDTSSCLYKCITKDITIRYDCSDIEMTLALFTL